MLVFCKDTQREEYPHLVAVFQGDIICLGKSNRGDRKLSEANVQLIKEYVYSSYNVEDPDYPCQLCVS